MNHVSNIFTSIYNFYPKHIPYNRKKGKAYKKTKEYKAFIKKRKKTIRKQYQQIESFRRALQDILELEVTDFCNLSNDVSYRYHCVLESSDENGQSRILELAIVISYLDLYYCYFFIETVKNKDTGEIVRDSIEDFEIEAKYKKSYEEKLKKLDSFFLQRGYCFVDNPLDKLDNVETEFTNKGEATVYSCLFSDLIR